MLRYVFWLGFSQVWAHSSLSYSPRLNVFFFYQFDLFCLLSLSHFVCNLRIYMWVALSEARGILCKRVRTGVCDSLVSRLLARPCLIAVLVYTFDAKREKERESLFYTKKIIAQQNEGRPTSFFHSLCPHHSLDDVFCFTIKQNLDCVIVHSRERYNTVLRDYR